MRKTTAEVSFTFPELQTVIFALAFIYEFPEKWDGLDESVSDKNEKFKKLSEVK